MGTTLGARGGPPMVDDGTSRLPARMLGEATTTWPCGGGTYYATLYQWRGCSLVSDEIEVVASP
jgi:hypothetical protein